jgi:hypothetical protein
MEARIEWSHYVPKQKRAYLTAQELADIGRTVAMAAPESRWPVIKEWAQYLHLMQRLPYVHGLDDYLGTVVSVAYDCMAEQAVKDVELQVIQQKIDRDRMAMLKNPQRKSDKNDSEKKKGQKSKGKNHAQ